MKTNKEKAKDFFAFSRREQGGLAILFGVLILLLGYFAFRRYLYQPKSYDFSAFQQEIDAFYAESEMDSLATSSVAKDSLTAKKIDKKKTYPKKEFHGFMFNPNTISQEQWVQLGLSPKQAASIVKYRVKGGIFRIKSDVKKMYTISDKKYQELYPWIDLPEKKENLSSVSQDKNMEAAIENSVDEKTPFSKTKTDHNLPLKSINLNTADTTELKKIRGIGSYYARKIVEYRNQLGGYISFDQLEEIWKMRQETLDAMEPYVFVAPQIFRPLRVNVLDANSLKNHPYVTWNIARAIVNYREQHGTFTAKKELKKILILTDEDYQKIAPYISLK